MSPLRSLGWRAFFVATIVSIATMAPTASAAPATERACTVETVNPEQVDVTCPLDGARVRFESTFTGGHDDTRASLRARVDGRPYDCVDGSKTSLFGEDGEVRLFCDVETTGRVLTVSVVFSHAQYAGSTFRPR